MERPLPTLKPIRVKVADTTDEKQFPEIAAACRWAREQREKRKDG